MTTKLDVAEAQQSFINGEPRGHYDEVYRCFGGDHNGLLFRCVDTRDEKKHKWFFYNDTVDTIMKVRTVFTAAGSVRGVYTARTSTQTNPSTGELDTVVELEVGPMRTEAFIEGLPNGFEMEFQTESAPAEDVEFENGKPSRRFAYDKIYKCFKNSGNGLFFRLVDEKKGAWYFHNDTQQYNMVATVEFEDRSDVAAVGNTEEIGTPEGNPNGVILRLTVAPLTTEPFITGSPSNYRLSFSADPINNDTPEDPENLQYKGSGPSSSIVNPHTSKIYKCFKKNDNGLLFRCVDEERNVWAFYNDTEYYTMTATIKFPQDEEFTPSEDTTVSEDPDEPGIIVVKMEIPPLTTLKFIDGNPKNFETSYTAVKADAPQPLEAPKFVNGEPDKNIMDYDQVTMVVKQQNSEDGVLYRLFDSGRKKWGFYNDSNDITMTARVKFNEGASIRKFHQTEVDTDESGESNGFVYVTVIKPHETVEFIEGQYNDFESKFTGVRKV